MQVNLNAMALGYVRGDREGPHIHNRTSLHDGIRPRVWPARPRSFARVYRLLRDEGGMDSARPALSFSRLLINLVLSLRLWEGEKELIG